MQIWDLVVLFSIIFSSFRGGRRGGGGGAGDKWEKRCSALLTGDAPDSKFFSQQRLDLLTLISSKITAMQSVTVYKISQHCPDFVPFITL